MTTPNERPSLGDDGPSYGDTDAQQHPEGNAEEQTGAPQVGLPVDDGHPSGEQNGGGDLGAPGED